LRAFKGGLIVTNPLRGSTAIVGVGHSSLGKVPGWSSLELMAQATRAALDDAGLTLADVDGVCASTLYHFLPSLSAAEYLGIHPKWSGSESVGGSSFMSHVLQATLAINAGLCETVLIAYGSNARSSGNLNGLIETPRFEEIYDLPVPMAGYAMATARHMYQYGTTRKQLAEVAVAARRWAQLNPEATMRDDLTIEKVLSAPTICDPLTRYDCCLVSDGGAAIILMSAKRARALKRKSAYVLGVAGAHWHREISQMPDLTVTAATESSSRAYEMAGVTAKDVDVVELYDAFTINTVLFLEDLGFCSKGEGGAFIENGRIAPGGSLPVNTNGGGLSCVHPGMYGLFCLIEAARQVRGDAPGYQVKNAEIAIAHGNGGTLSHQCTTILGADSTV
jgi:acetyl-CoA acetyltransferase